MYWPRSSLTSFSYGTSYQEFQSTLPREGSYPDPHSVTAKKFQSTPSSQRETKNYQDLIDHIQISIHSLLAEGDGICGRGEITLDISIHSLLAEGDCQALHGLHAGSHFNPLPPRRGRRQHDREKWEPSRFQSTPSSQRETAKTHKNTSCPLTYYTQNPQ